MKRIALISVLLALVLSLSGCKKEEEPVCFLLKQVFRPDRPGHRQGFFLL